MKRLIVLWLALFSLSCFGQNSINFDSYKYHFGTIAEVDGVVSHTFKYTNNGTEPFVITSVATSCGCTEPSYSREPLMAGQSGAFTIQFNPADRPGRFDKNILLSTNAGPITLVISGIVTPRPRTIKDDFPFPVGSQLRASDLLLRVEPAQRNHPTAKVITVINDSYLAATLSLDTASMPDWLSARITTPFLNPNAKTTIILTVNSPNLWGLHSISIPIIVNGAKQPENINITAVFTRNLDATPRATAPKAELSTYFYHFSSQKAGAKPSYTIKIRNTGLSTLYIDHIEADKDISYTISKTAIPPSATANLTVTLAITSSDYISQAIRIICSDPFSSVREIRLVANGF